MENLRKVLDFAKLGVLLVVVVWALSVLGIGCPIKFITGISCPGCGMTRAWLCALSLRFNEALAYHPLFWTLPLILLLVCVRDKMPKRLFSGALYVFLALFLVVWIIRLATLPESNVLFSNTLQEDIVSIGPPPWATFLISHFL